MGRVELVSIGTGLMDMRELFREAIGPRYPFEIVIQSIVPVGKPETTKLTIIVYGDGDPVVFQEEGMIDDAAKHLLAKIDPCPTCNGAGKLLIEEARNVGTEEEIPAKYNTCRPCRGWGRRRERV